MTRKQQEKEYYKKQIDLTCEDLNISQEKYNTFKRLGRKLQHIYESQCNGFQDSQYNWDEKAERHADLLETTYTKVAALQAKKQGLQLFLQTDPRGATVYLSKDKIEDNNYNRPGVYCIY